MCMLDEAAAAGCAAATDPTAAARATADVRLSQRRAVRTRITPSDLSAIPDSMSGIAETCTESDLSQQPARVEARAPTVHASFGQCCRHRHSVASWRRLWCGRVG